MSNLGPPLVGIKYSISFPIDDVTIYSQIRIGGVYKNAYLLKTYKYTLIVLAVDCISASSGTIKFIFF